MAKKTAAAAKAILISVAFAAAIYNFYIHESITLKTVVFEGAQNPFSIPIPIRSTEHVIKVANSRESVLNTKSRFSESGSRDETRSDDLPQIARYVGCSATEKSWCAGLLLSLQSSEIQDADGALSKHWKKVADSPEEYLEELKRIREHAVLDLPSDYLARLEKQIYVAKKNDCHKR